MKLIAIKLIIEIYGSREEEEVAGIFVFSHTDGGLGLMSVLQG